VFIAVHLPAHFTASFVKRLQRLSPLPVKVGQAGMSIEAGQIIVAPGGQNMEVKSVKRGPWQVWQTDFNTEHSQSADQPSVDLLMQSAAQAAGSKVIGVILTGLGSDGTHGSQCIQRQGGQVIAQNEESAAVFSMPHSVIRAGYASAVLPLKQIATAINRRAALPTPVSASYSPVETLN
jgi:two-component system chemotaxis response regulator CheB